MDPKVSKNVSVICNTNSSKSRQGLALKHTFTWNNYPDGWLDLLSLKFEGLKWIAGEEIGEEGTKHLQGYVEHGKKVRPVEYYGLPKELHWESARKCQTANVRYCTKDGKAHGTLLKPKDLKTALLYEEYSEVEWHCWQQEVLDLMESKTFNRRHINWWWNKKGNIGKSFVLKYVALKYDVILCQGKTDDIFNQLRQWREKNPDKLAPDAIIVNMPRTHEHINTYAIEQVLDGMLYSGKYEGGQIFIGKTRCIVMANNPPNYEEKSKLSSDRWNVKHIKVGNDSENDD